MQYLVWQYGHTQYRYRYLLSYSVLYGHCRYTVYCNTCTFSINIAIHYRTPDTGSVQYCTLCTQCTVWCTRVLEYCTLCIAIYLPVLEYTYSSMAMPYCSILIAILSISIHCVHVDVPIPVHVYYSSTSIAILIKIYLSINTYCTGRYTCNTHTCTPVHVHRWCTTRVWPQYQVFNIAIPVLNMLYR